VIEGHATVPCRSRSLSAPAHIKSRPKPYDAIISSGSPRAWTYASGAAELACAAAIALAKARCAGALATAALFFAVFP